MATAQEVAAEINKAKTAWDFFTVAADDGSDDEEDIDEWEAFAARWSIFPYSITETS